MSERTRAEPSAPEQSRAHPSAQQLDLPMRQIEESDAAYLDALRECGLSTGIEAVCRWLVEDGIRESGAKVLPMRPQRQLAARLGLSASTVCESLRRLQSSGLLTRADGDWRLDLSLLVSVSEEARQRRATERAPMDAAAALDCLLSGGARSACSGALGLLGPTSVSVRKENIYPDSVSDSESVSGGAGGLPSAAERGEQEDCLADHPAWKSLQTHHFRDAAGRPKTPELHALRPCFYAAVASGLLDKTDEHRIRFLAAAWDLAHSLPRWDPRQKRQVGAKLPAVCLRKRTERNALWRSSPEAHRWAKAIVHGTQQRAEAVDVMR